jgi:hypothetical protein
MADNIPTCSDYKVAKLGLARQADLCCCGGRLLLAGASFVGPTSYMTQRRCHACGLWCVRRKNSSEAEETVEFLRTAAVLKNTGSSISSASLQTC